MKPLPLPAIQALGCDGGETILNSWVAAHFPDHGSRADHLGLLVLTSSRLAFLESAKPKHSLLGMYDLDAYRLVSHLTWTLETITEIGVNPKYGRRYLEVTGHIIHPFRSHPKSVIDEVVYARAQRVAANQVGGQPIVTSTPPHSKASQVGAPGHRPCPFCGKWGPSESEFCHKCGRPLPPVSGR